MNSCTVWQAFLLIALGAAVGVVWTLIAMRARGSFSDYIRREYGGQNIQASGTGFEVLRPVSICWIIATQANIVKAVGAPNGFVTAYLDGVEAHRMCHQCNLKDKIFRVYQVAVQVCEIPEKETKPK